MVSLTPPLLHPFFRLDEWIHLVYVNRTGSGIDLYMNGELAGHHPSNIALPRDQIGSWSDTIPESPLAIIDEVVLYDRALSPIEISAHFALVPEPIWSPIALAAFAIHCVFRPQRFPRPLS